MGSKKTTKTTSSGTQTVAPPSWTMPGISDVASKVTAAVANLPTVKYSGDFVATPDQGLIDGALDAYKSASGMAGTLANTAAGATTAAPALNYSTALPSTGTYDLTTKLAAALDPLTQTLTRQVLPGLRSSAIDSGAYSGTRSGLVEDQAINDYTRNASDTLANLSYQDYLSQQQAAQANYGLDTTRTLGSASTEQAYRDSLPSLIDTALRAGTGSGDILSQAASLDAATKQAGINNALAKDQAGYTQPFQGLDIATQLLQALSGNYGTTSTNSTGTTVQSSSGLGNVVQGIAGLASLAGSFASPTTFASSLFKNVGASTLANNASALAASGNMG